MKKIFTLLTLLFLFGVYDQGHAQLTVSTALTPSQLVQNVLVGTGVTVSNVTYSGLTGASSSIGEFTTGMSPTNLGLAHGIIMSTGLVNGTPSIGSPVTNFASNINGALGTDPDLQNLVTSSFTVMDVSKLEFDFVPLSDTIKFRYVFGSEEYPEFVNTSFNDVFGFFITGPNPMGGNYTNKNIALIPGTALPVTIDNVNSGSYAIYYIDNQAIGGQTIVYDGFTTVLTAWCLVVPCLQYHIKLAIGDVGDQSYDSAVFLEANSFSATAVSISTYYSTPTVGNNAVEGCNDGIISFHLPNPASSPYNISYVISGTATNGTDYTTIPNSVTIPAGQDSVNLVIHPFFDSIPEGTETVTLIVQTSVCGGSDTVTINILDNQPMNIIMSNDTLICGGSANIWAQVSGGIVPYVYTWNNGAGNASSAVVSPTSTTTYSITATDKCGYSIHGDVTISWGVGSAEAGPDVTLCAGNNTTLTAIGATAGYLWSTGDTSASINVMPATTTTYYVTAYGACDAFDSVTVFINPNPVIFANASSPSIYNGENVTLTTGGGSTYQWSANPFDPSLTSQANSISPTVTPQASTTYSVLAYDSNGCSGSASVTVMVVPVYPDVNFTAYPDSGCEALIVQFTDHSGRLNPGATYHWDFGNGTTSDSINPMAYYPYHGSYDVSLTITNPGPFASALTQHNMITVYPKPIAVFQTLPNREVTLFESTINFFDETIGFPVKWSWSFGDGDTSALQNTYHQYQDTGSYLVTLISTTQYSCSDTLSTIVRVRPDYYLYVPSAFTPNQDGKNDIFFVQGGRILEGSFEMRIFTRWGQEIYFSNNIYQGWDGKYNDQKANCDTYVYDIRFMDEIYQTHRVTGTVMILR